jgi:hypothetical protein
MSISAGVGSVSSVSNPNIPINVVSPELEGTFVSGSQLRCSGGEWLNDPIIYNYQWYRNENEIIGAESSRYVLVFDDIDTIISCLVTAINEFGRGSAFSNRVYIDS